MNWLRMQFENNKFLIYGLSFLVIIITTFLLIIFLIYVIRKLKEYNFNRYIESIMNKEVDKKVFEDINKRKEIKWIKLNKAFNNAILIVAFEDETACLFQIEENDSLNKLTPNKKYSLKEVINIL